MPDDTHPEPDLESPHQRLTGKVQGAFTMACSQRDLPVAELLFSCLEHLARHHTDVSDSVRQAELDNLADAQGRLAALRAE